MLIYWTSVPFSRNYKTFSSMYIITGIQNINDIQNVQVFSKQDHSISFGQILMKCSSKAECGSFFQLYAQEA